MKLSRLRYFIAIAEAENLGRAAATLNLSKPTLSLQLRVLEEEVGGKLFDRHANGMTLTAAGEVLIDHARTIMDSAASALAEIRIATESAAEGGEPPSQIARRS